MLFGVKNKYVSYIITLTIGAGISQLIPVLASPILTRLYSPETFGLFSLFISVITILGSIANGRYDLALLSPKEEKQAVDIFVLGILISIVFSFLIFLAIFFEDWGLKYKLGFWIYFIPLSIFLLSLSSLLNYFNTRKECYVDIKNASINRSLSLIIMQLFFGIIKPSVGSLILSQLIAQNISIYKLWSNILPVIKRYKTKVSFLSIKKVAFLYKDFPYYSTMSTLLNTASVQIPVLIFANLYSLKIAGFYALSLRIVGLPMATVGSSIGQVFYQQASEFKNNGKDISVLTFQTYKRLLQLSVVPFSVLIFSSEILFSFIFGAEWKVAGEYTQILSLWFLFVFITSPLSNIMIVMGLQKQSFYLNLLIFILRIISIFVGYFLFSNAYYTVIIYGMAGFLFWFGFCIYLLLRVSVPIFTIIKTTSFYFLLGLMIGNFSKFILTWYLF